MLELTRTDYVYYCVLLLNEKENKWEFIVGLPTYDAALEHIGFSKDDMSNDEDIDGYVTFNTKHGPTIICRKCTYLP